MKGQIITASIKNLSPIARCHRAAFPASLSSALGHDYVEKMLSWYLSTENTFLFYVNEGDQCVGYCGGMVKTIWGVGSASSMAQFSFNAAVKSFLLRPWLVFHKEIRAKFPFIFRNLINRFFRKKKNLGDSTVIFEPYVGLVVIGVDPSYQGKGYGSIMLQEFERITRQRGLRKMVLSVQSKNSQAIASYERNGWTNSYQNEELIGMEKRI
jgi:GNAT superfamily N-acetyltransferase